MSGDALGLGWRLLETFPVPPYVTVLTRHEEDLYPVPAYHMEDGTWLRETEGPEDAFYEGGRNLPLYRTPTHWMPLP